MTAKASAEVAAERAERDSTEALTVKLLEDTIRRVEHTVAAADAL